eukprot:3419151-Rhodomonas_salina.1
MLMQMLMLMLLLLLTMTTTTTMMMPMTMMKGQPERRRLVGGAPRLSGPPQPAPERPRSSPATGPPQSNPRLRLRRAAGFRGGGASSWSCPQALERRPERECQIASGRER